MRTRSVSAVIALTAAVAACGGTERVREDRPESGPLIEDPGPIHVHGLGINPRDGALFVATHTGLFRAAPGESRARRVGGRYQDTMGFSVVGPDRFLGSGHPDAREDLPPFLGLIESRDAGRSWRPVSRQGESDFHVLEARGRRVYGFGSDFETRRDQFLVSSDGGRTWTGRRVPEPLVSLAIHPSDADRVVAAGESAVHASRDGGRTWRQTAAPGGLLAWSSPRELFRVDAAGSVHVSSDATRWRAVGRVGGEPSAFEAEEDGLYVALHDGTIKRSADRGRSWTIRSRP